MADLVEIPGLAHPLADEPGVEAAPQWDLARRIDRATGDWFTRYVS